MLLLQVSELKSQLAQAKSQQEKLRGEVAAAAAARDAAQERASALRSEVEQLQFMLDEVHAARTDSPPSKVRVGTCWGYMEGAGGIHGSWHVSTHQLNIPINSVLRSEVVQLHLMLDSVHAARTDSPPSKVCAASGMWGTGRLPGASEAACLVWHEAVGRCGCSWSWGMEVCSRTKCDRCIVWLCSCGGLCLPKRLRYVWPCMSTVQPLSVSLPAHVQAVQAAAAAAAQSRAVEQLRALQSSNSALREELATRSAALEDLVADRDEAAQRLADAQAQLETERGTAAAAKAAAAALERRLGDLSAQVRLGSANTGWP